MIENELQKNNVTVWPKTREGLLVFTLPLTGILLDKQEIFISIVKLFMISSFSYSKELSICKYMDVNFEIRREKIVIEEGS